MNCQIYYTGPKFCVKCFKYLQETLSEHQILGWFLNLFFMCLLVNYFYSIETQRHVTLYDTTL